jgi:hypothetical protein
MKLNIKIFIISLLVCSIFCGDIYASSNDFTLGIELGPAIGFHNDFNGQNSLTAMHFKAGVDALYKLSFLKDCYFEANFSYLLSSLYNYGTTTVQNTAIIGNFSERISYYGGFAGIRKNFSFEKFNPFIGLGFGVDVINISNISFTDGSGNLLPLSVSNSGYQLTVVPSIGLLYKISYKLAVDVAFRPHITTSFINNTFFDIPIGILYTF